MRNIRLTGRHWVFDGLYDLRNIDGYAKATFSYICRKAGPDGAMLGLTHYKRMADDIGFSERQVRYSIKALINVGMISRLPTPCRRPVSVAVTPAIWTMCTGRRPRPARINTAQ